MAEKTLLRKIWGNTITTGAEISMRKIWKYSNTFNSITPPHNYLEETNNAQHPSPILLGAGGGGGGQFEKTGPPWGGRHVLWGTRFIGRIKCLADREAVKRSFVTSIQS